MRYEGTFCILVNVDALQFFAFRNTLPIWRSTVTLNSVFTRATKAAYRALIEVPEREPMLK